MIVYKQPKQGFSLIEILVAITIMSGITIVLAQSLFTASRTSVKTDLKNTLKQGGEFSMRLMEQYIRASSDITSVCENSPGTQSNSLTIVNQDQATTEYSCEVDGEVTRIASISATPEGNLSEYITPSTMTLGDCDDISLFTCTQVPGLPKKVRIHFTLYQKGVPVDRFEQGSVTFDSTISLRN